MIDDTWRALADDLAVAISVIDLEGRQVYGNRQYRELLRVSEAEFDSLTVFDITDPADHDWTRRYLARLGEGDAGAVDATKVYHRPDGTTFVAALAARPVRDRSGEVIALAATITPVRHSGSRPMAADREVLLRRVLEAQRDLICLWQPDGLATFCNPAYQDFFGYDATGRNLFDLVPPEAIIKQRELIAAYESGEKDRHEFVRPYADGRVIEWIDSVIRDDGGQVRSILSVGRDISEQVQMLRRRSAFVAVASHELRNPLHGIIGIAELISTEVDDPHLSSLASTLLRRAVGLRQLVDDLLDLNRLDARGVAIVPTPTDLRSLVGDVISVIEHARTDAGTEPNSVILTAHLDDDVPSGVMVDGARLSQVLQNLVGNALKFTDAGSVSVEVGWQRQQLSLTVTDTGCGIDEAALAQVFEPFAQPGERRGGAGLGLAIVRGLVEAMGGTVAATSQPGAGSTFRVEIPAPRAVAPPAAPRVLEASSQLPMRVLVVEDDPTNRFLTLHQLRRLGMHAETAADREQTLSMLATETFDLILMDYLLPDANGADLTAEIRRLQQMSNRRVPIIGLTASTGEQVRTRCLEAGMDAILSKPATLSDLLRAVEQLGVAEATPTAPLRELDSLVHELGEIEVVRGLVRTFLDALDDRLTSIAGAARRGAVDDHVRATHTLGSAAALVGCTELATLCRRLEHTETSGPDELAELARLAAASRNRLEQWLETSPAEEPDGLALDLR